MSPKLFFSLIVPCLKARYIFFLNGMGLPLSLVRSCLSFKSHSRLLWLGIKKCAATNKGNFPAPLKFKELHCYWWFGISQKIINKSAPPPPSPPGLGYICNCRRPSYHMSPPWWGLPVLKLQYTWNQDRKINYSSYSGLLHWIWSTCTWWWNWHNVSVVAVGSSYYSIVGNI